MAKPPIVERVEILEQKVDLLETLPARLTAVEVQIVQLREEMHEEFSATRRETSTEFSAIRSEMAHEFSAVRSEMASEFSAVRSEMAQGFSAVRNEMAHGFSAVRNEMASEFSAVRGEMHAADEDLRAEMHALHRMTIDEIRSGDAETRRYTRVLFEELVSRITTLGENRRTRKKR